MADVLAMPDVLQDILDSIVSAHSSSATRSQALLDLEQLTARTFASSNNVETLTIFRSLQDTFECNVPSRVLSWMSNAVARLETLVNRGLSENERQAEAFTISSQLTRALSVIQGVALAHHPSKIFLGRKYPLETLVDLLLVSRHLMPTSPDQPPNAGSSKSNAASQPQPTRQTNPSVVALSSAALDTLLCILVDSSPALRIFEDLNGVQVVVRILKRANTLREVRMKCLEFLYFYLLDESPSSTQHPVDTESGLLAPPLSPSPFIKQMKMRDRLYGSNRDASTGSDDSYSSQSSSNSFRSTSSTLTNATSVSASSSRAPSTSGPAIPKTPPQSPTQPDAQPSGRQRSLLMLRKDVDFVPVTPKKVQVARLGLGHSRLSSIDTPGRRPGNPPADRNVGEETPAPGARDTRMPSHATGEDPRGDGIRSTEQKKEFLGKMMGNVDTLVEGVEKAGIWGLG